MKTLSSTERGRCKRWVLKRDRKRDGERKTERGIERKQDREKRDRGREKEGKIDREIWIER